MAEYIERDALMLHITEVKILLRGDSDWLRGCRDALQAIGELVQTAPAADVVEVVRCKDCEYYEDEECVCPYIFMSDAAHLYPSEDDFCNYGKRKE